MRSFGGRSPEGPPRPRMCGQQSLDEARSWRRLPRPLLESWLWSRLAPVTLRPPAQTGMELLPPTEHWGGTKAQTKMSGWCRPGAGRLGWPGALTFKFDNKYVMAYKLEYLSIAPDEKLFFLSLKHNNLTMSESTMELLVCEV